eukprot:gene388-489_t
MTSPPVSTFKINKVECSPIGTFQPFSIDNLYHHQQPQQSLSSSTNSNIFYKSVLISSPTIRSRENGLPFNLGCNSFIHSVLNAVSKNHHLLIRPDDIWSQVLVQLSLFLNANREKYASTLFVDPKENEMVFDDFFAIPYEDLGKMLVEDFQKKIKDDTLRMLCNRNFSTTTCTDKIVGSAILLGKKIEYTNNVNSKGPIFNGSCKLPKITILGTIEDWSLVIRSIKMLKFIDFENIQFCNWIESLSLVVSKILRSLEGHFDIDWWNKMVEFKSGSGFNGFTGWLTTFCNFSREGIEITRKKVWWFSSKTEYIFVDFNEIPSGFVSFPITIKDKNVNYETEMFTGHIVANSPNQTSINPQLDWIMILNQ